MTLADFAAAAVCAPAFVFADELASPPVASPVITPV
jgi:hypothetical protein